MITLNEEDIKIVELIIEDFPINTQVDSITYFQKYFTDNDQKVRIFVFLLSEKLITSNPSHPILTERGEKFKEFKTYVKYLNWDRENEKSKNIIKWITKKWWIPIAISFAFTMSWDYAKECLFKKSKINETTEKSNKQELVIQAQIQMLLHNFEKTNDLILKKLTYDTLSPR